MRKAIYFFLSLMLTLAVAGCGKGGDGKTIKVEGMDVFADDSLTENLKDFIDVESGDYTIAKSGAGLELTLKFESELMSSAKEEAETKAKAAQLSKCKLVVMLLDKDGTELSESEMFLTGATLKDVISWVMSSELGDKKEYKFSMITAPKDLLEKVNSIKIYVKSDQIAVDDASAIGSEDSVSEDNNEETAETDAPDEDFDELLNEYEEYYDEYIALLDKAANGDMDAITESQGLMEKAQSLAEKFEKYHGDMTAAQWAKFEKVQMKLINAAQKIGR